MARPIGKGIPGMGTKKAGMGPKVTVRGKRQLTQNSDRYARASEVASTSLGGSKTNTQRGHVGGRTYPKESGSIRGRPGAQGSATQQKAPRFGGSNRGAKFGGLKVDESDFAPTGPGAGGGPASLPGSGFTFGAGMGSHLNGPDEDVGTDGDQAHYGPSLRRTGRMNHPVWHSTVSEHD